MKDRRRPVTILEEPEAESAIPIIQRVLSERKTLLLVGDCSIDYVGRASSRLKAGDRIIIVKEDGSVLVHRPTDYSPVNWQPPGCLFETRVVRRKLLLRAVRRRPREVIKILFNRMYLVGVLDLVDEGEFHLYASEQDMQSAILAYPEIIERGFRPISYERRVEPGFVDVYGVDADGRLVVLEIKRRTAGKGAALQLARYIEAIKGDSDREVRGIIVAPSLAKGVQPLLATLNLEFKALSPRRCAQVLGRAEREKRLDSYLR